MKKVFFAALLVAACRSTTPPPVSSIDVPPPTAAPALSVAPSPPAPAEPTPAPSISFVEKGAQVLEWDFDVKGLPAIDDTSRTIVVGDLSHGHIASSLELTLRWLRPGEKNPSRTLPVIAPGEASHVLYDLDGLEAEAETRKLLARVRTKTSEANAALAKIKLRSLKECRPAKYQHVCTHPQVVECAGQRLELRGDELSSSSNGKTKLGWSVDPMVIGGPGAQVMLTCIQDAFYDPATRTFAARIEHACEGGGTDACFLPSVWKVASLR